MQRDYSQWREQELILKFFAGKTDGKFLDIGANDGLIGSNTRALAELGWGGVLIEANPRIFQQLVHNCRGNEKLICFNAPVQARCGMVKFFDCGSQCGTCNIIHQPANSITDSFWLNATCPEMIADQFGGSFDFVSLDIEGGDLEVLKRMAPVLGDTRLLCIEDAVPWQDFDQAYYEQMLVAAANHGLNSLVERTHGPVGTGNTLLTRP